MAGVASNIWEHGRLQTFGQYFPEKHLTQGWSQYGIGQSLILAPLWGLQSAFDPLGAIWMTLANPIVLAGCGAVFLPLGITIGLRRATALSTALVLGVLTMAPLYSTELFRGACRDARHARGRARHCSIACARVVGTHHGLSGAGQVLRFSSGSTPCCSSVSGTRSPDFVSLPLKATWRQWVPALAIPVGAADLAGVLQQPALRRAAPRQLLRCSLRQSCARRIAAPAPQPREGVLLVRPDSHRPRYRVLSGCGAATVPGPCSWPGLADARVVFYL